MSKKKLDELTEEQLSALTEEQLKALEETGEIEIEDTTPTEQPPQEGVEGGIPPQDNLTPEDIERLRKEAEEYKRKYEEAERARQGTVNDLVKKRQRLSELEQLIQQEGQTQKSKSVVDTIQDDDIITGQQVKQIMQEARQQMEMYQREQQMVEFQRRLVESRKRAESKYQDYPQVIQKFIDMSNSNPMFAQAILSDPDPAERAYQLGKAKELLDNQNKITDIKNKLGQQPQGKVLSGSKGTSTSKLTPEKFVEMSDEEIDKLPPEAIEELLRQTTGG